MCWFGGNHRWPPGRPRAEIGATLTRFTPEFNKTVEHNGLSHATPAPSKHEQGVQEAILPFQLESGPTDLSSSLYSAVILSDREWYSQSSEGVNDDSCFRGPICS